MAKPNDPYSAFNFLVEIDGAIRAGFTEVSGIESDTEVMEYGKGATPMCAGSFRECQVFKRDPKARCNR